MAMNSITSLGTPLNDTGVDLSNETQAANFLLQILDDSEFQVIGNGFARYFWYAMVVFMAIAATFNIFQVVIRKMR
jgi:ferric-chelate reductase